MGSSAKAIPNSTHSPISHFPLSRKQEQGRTRERKWRLEIEVKDEVKTWNPRSSSHQAQLILISWSWLAHELSSQLVGNFSQTLISSFHACIDHSAWWHLTHHKVRSRPYAWPIPRNPSQCCSHAFLWILARMLMSFSSRMESKMCSISCQKS